MKAEQWRCTAVKALELGLPGSLEGVSKAMNLEEGKLKEGKELIKFFSMPCKTSASNKGRSRNFPWDDEERWTLFKSYCIRDVEVERTIRNKLDVSRPSKFEEKLWILDQQINDEGIRVDQQLIDNVLECINAYEEAYMREASILTGLKNPKSAQQMKLWLFNQDGIQMESLSKAEVDKIIEDIENPEVKKALKLRQALSKTSNKKYTAMKKAMGEDERIRGLFQFYGANRTGRWAGRLVQVQNLPQSKVEGLEEARELLRGGNFKELEKNYGSVSEILSKLLRTAFIPKEGSRFIVSDFNAIEARIVAWLAGEGWRQKVFATHGKIYEASASKMFRVPIEEITSDSELRQKGKIAELALGYQGSKGALKAMGALSMGIKEEELTLLVKDWRRNNQRIVNLWWNLEEAAVEALKGERILSLPGNLSFYCQGGIFFIRLPSGRQLSYVSPRLERDHSYQRDVVSYMGVDQRSKQWTRLKTYGGKLLENIVQGIARDILGEAMINLEAAGYKVIMHIHDEVVLEVPRDFGSLEEVNKIMGKSIPWARGLNLKAEGFESEYYRK